MKSRGFRTNVLSHLSVTLDERAAIAKHGQAAVTAAFIATQADLSKPYNVMRCLLQKRTALRDLGYDKGDGSFDAASVKTPAIPEPAAIVRPVAPTPAPVVTPVATAPAPAPAGSAKTSFGRLSTTREGWVHMSAADREIFGMEHGVMTRAEWEGLNNASKSQFFKVGGKLVDSLTQPPPTPRPAAGAKTWTRAQFDVMGHSERNEFFKSGGKLTN